jgi:hypothetical protein
MTKHCQQSPLRLKPSASGRSWLLAPLLWGFPLLDVVKSRVHLRYDLARAISCFLMSFGQTLSRVSHLCFSGATFA